jgi:sorting nexin-8
MSLFGTSPDEASEVISARMSKSSLFADEPISAARSSGSALFADDDAGGDSPWDMPAPKKAARHKLVRTLLPATDVPDSYIDAYDLVLNSGDRVGAGVGLTAIREILSSSGLNARDQANILNLVIPSDQDDASGIGRNEFNVLLALVGFAQEGEDVTLDTVDERRKSTLALFSFKIFSLTFIRAPTA